MLGREYDARGVDCASDLGGCALGTEKRSRIARDPFQLPALELIESDRGYVSRSLQHEVIAECLRRADDALYAPEPGAALAVLGAPRTSSRLPPPHRNTSPFTRNGNCS